MTQNNQFKFILNLAPIIKVLVPTAPKSQSAPCICTSPMHQGIEKSPGSCSLAGDLKIELHARSIGLIDPSSGSPFLERKSLKNFR